MATTKRAAVRLAKDEPLIELEAFEEPIDKLFPRLPNIVSRKDHRALKIVVRVRDAKVIPPNATKVIIEAEVLTYGPDRMGTRGHLFRQRVTWGKIKVTKPLPGGHRPPYEFEVIVRKQIGDDHIGEGPFDAAVKLTPQGGGLAGTRTALDADVDPRVNIRFIAL